MKILLMMMALQSLNLAVFAWLDPAAWVRILTLRQQLAVYKRKSKKPLLRNRDRLFWSLLSKIWRDWRSELILVKPETVIRWRERKFREFWRRKPGRGRDGSRPPPPAQTRARGTTAHGSHLGFMAAREPVRLSAAHPAARTPVISGPVSSTRRLQGVLLGQLPSLHALRQRSHALVRALRRYYAAARLLDHVHPGLICLRLSPDGPPPLPRGHDRGLPVLAHEVSSRARGLRLRGVSSRLALAPEPSFAFPLRPKGRHPEFGFSKLNTRPVSASVYAWRAASRRPAQDSRSGWFATPFL
jgi:hypothetical protein